MTDYATRLVQRTLGVATLVRPDIAALPLGNAHTDEAKGFAQEDLLSDVPSSGDGTLGGQESPGPLALHPEPPLQATLRAIATQGAVAIPYTNPAQPLTARQTLPATFVVDPEDRKIRASAGNSPMSVPAKTISEPLLSPRITAERATPDVHTYLTDTPAAAAPPTINVTIGRIEVRTSAQSQPVPAAPTHGRRERQLQSLENYLRQRNGERS